MVKQLLVVTCLGAMACGGGKKADTTPEDPDMMGGGGMEKADLGFDNAGGPMIPPETVDQIQRMLARRSPAVSRCLTMAVEAKELPHTAKGKVTIEVTVSPSGKAEKVKILKATLDNKMVNDCVIERVQEIDFPQVPKSYPTTYQYSFEAT